MAQYEPADRALRGAEAIRTYVNSLLGGKSEPVSRSALYRMIGSGKLPVSRLSENKRAEVWSTERKIAAALGLDQGEATTDEKAE